MPLPVSRRQFLGTSAGSAVALSSGPLLVRADAPPSRKVTVGIMGLNRGMQVAAALEKQPGVVIKYVCDVDSKRADQAKAKLEGNGKQITWQGLSCNKHPDSAGYVSFYGDKGALALGQFGDYKIYDADDRLIEERPDDAGGGNPWLAVDTFHTANFIAAIRSGEHFGVSAQIEKGHRGTLLCHLGNIAYRTPALSLCTRTPVRK